MLGSRENRKVPSPWPNERGQVTILFALVFTFLLVILAFVVDFSNLVNAKINLQIAADNAAYAGAAYQANVLNRLSMMNYKIRQDVKELSMRIWVTHMRHNRGYPRGGGFINGGDIDASTIDMDMLLCQQAHGYVSLSGRPYQQDTNLCLNASPAVGGLPPIVVPPVIASFDPFAIALQAQIRSIADEANRECRLGADDNRFLAEHLLRVYEQRTRKHAEQMAQIANWLNEAPINPNHPIYQVAVETANRNLKGIAFLGDTPQFEVLRPAGGESIRLEAKNLGASVLYFDFNVVGDGCVAAPRFASNDNIVGLVRKTPEILTYFAVKVSLKPSLFFMPQRWVDAAWPELVAVAAAKPFGGRVGPSPEVDVLMPIQGGTPGNNNRTINFSFVPGDRLGFINTKRMALFDSAHPINTKFRPDGNQNSGWPDAGKTDAGLRAALKMIHAPTVFDAIYFNVFPNPEFSQDYEESRYAQLLFPDYYEVGNFNNGLSDSPRSSTSPYFPVDGNQNGAGWIPAFADGVTPGSYGPYALENFESHAITLASNAGAPQLNEGTARTFGFADRRTLHSGYRPNGQINGRLSPPRIGYSAKFVSMDSLVFKLFIKKSDGNPGPISNIPTGDPNLRNVLH